MWALSPVQAGGRGREPVRLASLHSWHNVCVDATVERAAVPCGVHRNQGWALGLFTMRKGWTEGALCVGVCVWIVPCARN
mmetsp:Transcript_54067/g.149099  ORF Transcript_54067/g.149099 Transcript_54067/m.149099 type:complete len:80 (+) Transcript_54067:846-1085(+)|eukprot:675481-Prymnesium_polylepis.1